MAGFKVISSGDELMSDKDLNSKVVIVTGAGGGLGRAMISGLAEKGARLALVDIDPAALASITE